MRTGSVGQRGFVLVGTLVAAALTVPPSRALGQSAPTSALPAATAARPAPPAAPSPPATPSSAPTQSASAPDAPAPTSSVDAPAAPPAPLASDSAGAAPAASTPIQGPAPTSQSTIPEHTLHLPPAPDYNPNKPAIGGGFHPFDKRYLLLGVNWELPCQSSALELEGSIVPFISDNLWWGGLWASGGQQFGKGDDAGTCGVSGRKPDSTLTGWRAAAGGELGWRVFAVDAGFLHNNALTNGNGLRFRVGLALADEFFTGGHATYSRSCCTKNLSNGVSDVGTKVDSDTACECDRTPVGVSLFIYYANELYWDEAIPREPTRKVWDNGMFGISLKVGVGL